MPLSLVVLVFVSASVSAEVFTPIWTEDFCNGATNWHVVISLVTSQAFPTCDLVHDAGINAWVGPSYRNAAGSTWNPVASPVMAVQLDALQVLKTAPDDQNRQFAVRIEAGHGTDPGLGTDYMTIRLLRAPCCLTRMQWEVDLQDNGGALQVHEMPIVDIGDLAIYANITVNTVANRVWINWSASSFSGSNSTVWTNDVDGPFAQSTAQYVNLLSYSSSSNGAYYWALDNIALYNVTADPAAPPPPPVLRGPIHADFAFSTSALGTQFYDASKGPGKDVKWIWNFDDGYGSQRQDPFHSFMCRGNYTVSLVVQDEYGNHGNVSARVFIADSKPLCGVLGRGEEGLHIVAAGHAIDLPTGLFILLAAFSAASLALGIEIPFYPRPLRWLALFVALVFLLFTLGVVGSIVALFPR